MRKQAGGSARERLRPRALLSTYGSRGDVEPIVGLAVRSRALGAEARVCAPPECAVRLAEVKVPLAATGLMPTGGWR